MKKWQLLQSASAFYNPCVWTKARRAWGAWVSAGRTFSPSRRVTFSPHHSWKEQEWTRAGSEGERAQAINKPVKTSQETWVRSDPITSPGVRASGSPRDLTVIIFKALIFPERFPPFRSPGGINTWMVWPSSCSWSALRVGAHTRCRASWIWDLKCGWYTEGQTFRQYSVHLSSHSWGNWGAERWCDFSRIYASKERHGWD